MHADVDVYESGNSGADICRRGAQGCNRLSTVDDGDHASACLQFGQPPQFTRIENLIGQQNVGDAMGDHELRLAELGTGDTDGPRGPLQPSDLRALVHLAVGAPGGAVQLTVRDHLSDIRLESIQLHHQCPGDAVNAGRARADILDHLRGIRCHEIGPGDREQWWWREAVKLAAWRRVNTCVGKGIEANAVIT